MTELQRVESGGKPATPVERRMIALRATMGDKYCCHPSRQVKRLAEPLADSHGTDIRATFKRATEQPKIETVTR